MMNGDSYHHQNGAESLFDGYNYGSPRSNGCGYATIPTSSSLNPSPSPPPSRGSSSPIRANYIEHRVSKMDTLAGVAIKYGVEVADIRRMNSLVTDLQMFALDVLKIPLPGRHPPSPIVPNGSATNGEQTPPPSRRPHDDILDSIQSLKLRPPRRVSPAMSSLQGYYGLAAPKRRAPVVEAEMSVYRTGRAINLSLETGRNYDPGRSLPRKSRSMLSLENIDIDTSEDRTTAQSGDSTEYEKFVGRRQKADTGPISPTPQILMKEDSVGGGFLGRTGNGLALRPKIGSRMDIDAGKQNSITATAGDFLGDVFVSVRKSSSTSNLQETENSSASSSSSSIWPTSKWSLKPDSIARPIFDGFATARKNKAALD